MRLIDYRMKQGIDRRVAAQQIGVDHCTFWRWETGRVLPTAAHVKKISDWSGGRVKFRDLESARAKAVQ